MTFLELAQKVLALQIIDNIEAGLASFREIVSELEEGQQSVQAN
jgi:hypothetical protein